MGSLQRPQSRRRLRFSLSLSTATNLLALPYLTPIGCAGDIETSAGTQPTGLVQSQGQAFAGGRELIEYTVGAWSGFPGPPVSGFSFSRIRAHARAGLL